MKPFRIQTIRHPERLSSYLMHYKFTAAAILGFGVVFNASMVLSPIYQGKLIDSIVLGGGFLAIVRTAATFVTLVLIIQTMRFFKRFFVRKFANVTAVTMRSMLYNDVLHHSIAQLENENVGQWMTRMISDVDLCVEGLRKLLTEIFDTGVLMLAYVVAMLAYDVKLSLLSMLFIPVAMILAESLKGIIFKYVVASRQKSGEVADLTYDLIDHSMLYRVSGMEAANRLRYEAELIQLEQKAVKANILENSMQPIYHVIASIGIILVIYLGGSNVISGEWTIGVFSTYLTMFLALAIKASKASKLFNSVQKSQVSWQRIRPYMHEFVQKEGCVAPDQSSTKLAVTSLSLRYGPTQTNSIESISFFGHQGEIIGITGPIASGKTTLGKALSGLYPYEGSVLIDGKELRDYTETERSSMISYLGHRAELFTTSIAENISFGDDIDVTKVLHDVCFDKDLTMMSDGIKTIVGNAGVRLSGGQQARIALARALIHKKKIIVLDDPFSAIDMATEETILRNLRQNYQNSLIILISHRLAVFPKLEKIILMQNGKSILSGTHEELIRSSELYASIYRLQNKEGDERHET